MGKAKRISSGWGIAVATVVVAAAMMPTHESTVSPAVRLTASTACTGTTEMRCALLMGATTIPTWNEPDVERLISQFIAPTHPGQTIEPVAVRTPEQAWLITSLIRLICSAVCDPSVFGPGGAAWPNEPWWKLSGLFDLTMDQSVQAGVADLERAMAESGNDHLVIYGHSQSAVIANIEKQRLAEQYPDKTTAPDIDFVLGGDPNVPNGGLYARFPGLHIPVLDWSLNGPESTDTPFDTVVIVRQYDLFADFPLYPLNAVALLNALLGGFYVHGYAFDVSVAPDPSGSPPIETQHGDTTYYFFETKDLPLFAPLRALGVPEVVIDVVEPFIREVVELGYDRGISPGQPTPARIIPRHDPAAVAKDLFDAIGAGVKNAAAMIGAPAPLSVPAVQTADSSTRDAAVEHHRPAPGSTIDKVIDQVNHLGTQGVSAATDHNGGAVKSFIGNGRSIIRSALTADGSAGATPTANRTPMRDAVKNARIDVETVVTKVSDAIKKAFDCGKHHGGGGVAEATPAAE